MLGLLLPSLLLFLFGAFTLLGVRPDLVINQSVFIAVGCLIYLLIKKIGTQFFRINASFFYWFFTVLLLTTFFIGIEAKGSKRWIDLYLFNFQASEFFKVFFILFFADFFSKNRLYGDQAKAFIKSLLIAAVPIFVIFKQPDLATALTYIFIYLILLLFSKVPKVYLLNFSIFALFILPSFFLFLKDYQKARIMGFLNPHLDQQGTSYNMTQAIIAVGSGQFFGKGLGAGTQSALHFLPENHTDFAFSALVEQFGFLGGTVVIGLYCLIAYNLVKKLITFFYERGEEGKFKFLFTLGFLAFFVFQVLVNIGMNVGLLPIAGIALPLISYGGSALVTWMVGLALLP